MSGQTLTRGQKRIRDYVAEGENNSNDENESNQSNGNSLLLATCKLISTIHIFSLF